MSQLVRKSKILLVDDDEDVREMLVDELISLGYDVETAANGQEGLKLFVTGVYDAVLSDIRMPQMNGVELLQAIKGKTTTPVILMTGFSEILETKTAYDLGADEFLPKPFKQAELEAALNNCIVKKIKSTVSVDNEYCKILVYEIPAGKPTAVDLFFRLSESKYLKIVNKSAPVDPERFRTYIARGLSHLHVRKEDFANYVGFAINTAREVTQDKNATTEQKQAVLKTAAEAVMQQIYKTGITPARFSEAKELVDRTIKLVDSNFDLNMLLESLNEHSDTLYAHALGVSFYCSAIARELGWTSPITISKIAMAGLFHDIGIKELDPKIVLKSRAERTAEESKIFESHSYRGRDILRSIPGVPDDLASVAAQHHESCNGLGYPGRLKKQQIHPLARITKVADLFCELTIKSQYSVPMEPPKALNEIYVTYPQEVDLGYLAALFSMFKVPMPLELEKAWSLTLKGA